jgi:UDP-3-O-[3-hydroxymyristoyl] glucosamine N-acyltransferase
MHFTDVQSLDCHPSALVYGEVCAEAETSVWPNVVIRAAMHRVHIGRRTNLQDFVMVHVGYHTPTLIGADCSITHHCSLRGDHRGWNGPAFEAAARAERARLEAIDWGALASPLR